jgi:hypothetical protein
MVSQAPLVAVALSPLLAPVAACGGLVVLGEAWMLWTTRSLHWHRRRSGPRVVAAALLRGAGGRSATSLRHSRWPWHGLSAE